MTVKDAEFCGSLASKGAACFHTLTDETRTMSLDEFAVYWNDLSDPKIVTTASAFAGFKADLEQLCSFETGTCTAEMETKVVELTDKFNGVVSKAKKWQTKK